MNLYRVYEGRAGGSGFAYYLVKANSEAEAIEIVMQCHSALKWSLSADLVEFKGRNKNIYTICEYDDPNYEG